MRELFDAINPLLDVIAGYLLRPFKIPDRVFELLEL
jgi:hypothetical protein